MWYQQNVSLRIQALDCGLLKPDSKELKQPFMDRPSWLDASGLVTWGAFSSSRLLDSAMDFRKCLDKLPENFPRHVPKRVSRHVHTMSGLERMSLFFDRRIVRAKCVFASAPHLTMIPSPLYAQHCLRMFMTATDCAQARVRFAQQLQLSRSTQC